jgi:hypothetical protein
MLDRPRIKKAEGSRTRRIVRDGREARTAVPVSPSAKALLAAAGALVCLMIAVPAWRAGPAWLAIPLSVLAGWALLDVVWQLVKLRRSSRRHLTTEGAIRRERHGGRSHPR